MEHIENDRTGSLAEICERQQEEIRLLRRQLADAERRSETDKLTGLLNREAFTRRATELISSHPAATYLVLSLDLDHFREFNERYGYETGNEVLCATAEAIRCGSPLGTAVLAARYSADRFFALYEAAGAAFMPEGTADFPVLHPDVLCYRGGFVIIDPTLSITKCIDYSVMAMMEAKAARSRQLVMFTRARYDREQRGQYLNACMDQAMADHEICVHYQPQVYIGTADRKKTLRAEALCRWYRNGTVYAMPDEIIPALEHSGQIARLDLYMLEQVCLMIRDFRSRYEDPIQISVNVSRRTLLQEGFAEAVMDTAKRIGVPNSCLEIEVTETMAIHDYSSMRKPVAILRSAGIRVALDDFGARYSSLDMLRKLPIDTVKIDRHFFVEHEDSHRHNAVIGNIVAMAKDLEADVVAEGIGNEETLMLLEQIGCDYVQADYFSRAVPPEELERWFKSTKAERRTATDADRSLQAYNAYFRRDRFNISSKEYDDILTAAKIGVWAQEMSEGEPAKLYADRTMERLIGVPHGNAPEDNYALVSRGVDPAYREALDRYFEEIRTNGSSEVVYPYNHPDGSRITIRCVGVLDRNYVRRGSRIFGYHQDITQTALEKAYARMQQTNRELTEQLEIIGAMTKISYNTYLIDIANDTFQIIKQQPQVDAYIREGMGLVNMVTTLLRTLDQESRERLTPYISDAEKVRAFTRGRDTAMLEYRSVTGVWNRAHMAVISRNAEGETDRLLWLMVDIDDEKKREQSSRERLKLAEQERDRDAPTGLMNRRAAEKRMREIMAQNSGERFVLMIVDLDLLKNVNDTYGHRNGDRAIRELADSMRQCFRENDILGRYGGDEFIVLMHELPDNFDVQKKLEEFLTIVGSKRVGDQNQHAVSCSVGIVSGQIGTISADEALLEADIALYQAKAAGRRTGCIYKPGMKRPAADGQ